MTVTIKPEYRLIEECCTKRVFQILSIIPTDVGVPSGELKHRLTLHAPEGTYGTGVAGAPASAVDLATAIPAKVEAVPLQFQQQERLAAGGLSTQTLYAIKLRDGSKWTDLTCVVGDR